MTMDRAAEKPIVVDPEAGDFVVARGKSWIVERAERAGPVHTLHLVSCEDDSQGEAIQFALGIELQTQVVDPNDWSPLLSRTFEGPPRPALPPPGSVELCLFPARQEPC